MIDENLEILFKKNECKVLDSSEKLCLRAHLERRNFTGISSISQEKCRNREKILQSKRALRFQGLGEFLKLMLMNHLLISLVV
jgi:hypothetical protein